MVFLGSVHVSFHDSPGATQAMATNEAESKLSGASVVPIIDL